MNYNTRNDDWQRPKRKRGDAVGSDDIPDYEILLEVYLEDKFSERVGGTLYFTPGDVLPDRYKRVRDKCALSGLLGRIEGDIFAGKYIIRLDGTYNRTMKRYVCIDIDRFKLDR